MNVDNKTYIFLQKACQLFYVQELVIFRQQVCFYIVVCNFTHSRRELIPPVMNKDDRIGTSLIRM